MTIAVRRSSTLPIAAIVAVTFAAWIAFVSVGMSSAGIAIFLLGWVAMMTAMMLPSVAPLVLVFGKRGRGRLVLGYLLVWAVAGLPVYAIARAADLMMVPAEVEAAVLVAAGAYQFTHLKNVCLRVCRSPLDFIAMRWGRGPLRLGVEHGAYCLGCCWALMAVLVGAAAMSVWAAAVIAALVFAEKVLPWGQWTARVAGLVLFGAAVVVLV